jgi:thioredoxin reductase (NADPH)
MRYDVAIIGTGPGGVSAALTLKNRGKNFIIIGSKQSAKVSKAHAILNYPGLPNVSGQELANAFSKHLEIAGIEITEDRVSTIYDMGDFFGIQGGNEMYEASAVILATGVVTGKAIPGEDALLGSGVSYCATCDAPLYKGKDVAVIGYSKKEEEEAAFLSEVCANVTYVPMYKEATDLPDKVKVVNVKPSEILKVDDKRVVKSDGEDIVVDCVFVLRDAISPGQLVPGLETDGAHVVVKRDMSTNIAGCFACGDITGLPYQYVKSAGEGNVAALSAVTYLAAKK